MFILQTNIDGIHSRYSICCIIMFYRDKRRFHELQLPGRSVLVHHSVLLLGDECISTDCQAGLSSVKNIRQMSAGLYQLTNLAKLKNTNVLP